MKYKSDILTAWGVCCEEDGNLDVLWKQVISAQASLIAISANRTPLYDGPLQRGSISTEKRSTIAVICRGAIEVEWLFISKYFIVFRILNFFWEQKFLLKNNPNFSQDNFSMKQGPIYFHVWNKFSNTSE